MYTLTWLKIVNRDLIHKGLQRVTPSGLLSKLDIEKVVVSIGIDATQRSGAVQQLSGSKKGQRKVVGGSKTSKSTKPSAPGTKYNADGSISGADGASGGNSLTSALSMMALITGQRPYVTKAHKSIAAWQLRAGQAIGCKTTLRGCSMWEFLDKTLKVALWRSQSYAGVATSAITPSSTKYSLTVGIPDVNIYPETDTDLTYIVEHASSVKQSNDQSRLVQSTAYAPCLSSIGRVLASGGSKLAVNSLLPEVDIKPKLVHGQTSINSSNSDEHDATRNSVTRSSIGKLDNKRSVAKERSNLSSNTQLTVHRRSAFGLQFTIVVSEKVLTYVRPSTNGNRAVNANVLKSNTKLVQSIPALESRSLSKKANISSGSRAVAVYLSGFDLLMV